jgi:hypothetical protein
MTCRSFDLELSIHTSCDAKVRKDSAGTIPAKNCWSAGLPKVLANAQICQERISAGISAPPLRFRLGLLKGWGRRDRRLSRA